MLGTRECILVEVRVESSSRNDNKNGQWGKGTQDERTAGIKMER